VSGRHLNLKRIITCPTRDSAHCGDVTATIIYHIQTIRYIVKYVYGVGKTRARRWKTIYALGEVKRLSAESQRGNE